MVGAVNARGFHVLEDHHLVQIVMTDVQSSTLPADYGEDCLDRLGIEKEGGFLRVRFESHLGKDGDVVCAGVSIGSVVRCDACGKIANNGG